MYVAWFRLNAAPPNCVSSFAFVTVTPGLPGVRSGAAALGIETVVCSTRGQAQSLPQSPCLILAGSGMCNGGRILHHLKHNLWKPETEVIFVGFQAGGTLGRALIEGSKQVRVLGEPVAVRAGPARPRTVARHSGRRGNRPRIGLPSLASWTSRASQRK